MALIAIDIGGTKIAGALFSDEGELFEKIISPVDERKGAEIGDLACDQIKNLLQKTDGVKAIGVSVPGIYFPEKGTVWAPNLPEWESFPLKDHIQKQVKNLSVTIDSDRSCYILGEVWQGNARGCKDAIFLAVGTGIGAGILVDGRVLHGTGNIAGAVGWMGLNRPYRAEYSQYGCFEYHASGEGLVRVAHDYLNKNESYNGELQKTDSSELNTRDVFAAFEKNDPIAVRVIHEAVEFWGMATANLISIFNPEKIIFGGGVFDAAESLLDQIKEETKRWAQPIAINQVSIDIAGLGNEAGIYGAAYLALTSQNSKE